MEHKKRTPWWHWPLIAPLWVLNAAMVLWVWCFGLTFFAVLIGFTMRGLGFDPDWENLGAVGTFLRWTVFNPLVWAQDNPTPGIAGAVLLGLMTLFLVMDKRLKRRRRLRWAKPPTVATVPRQTREASPRPAEPVPSPAPKSPRFPMATTGRKWVRCPDCGLQHVGNQAGCPGCTTMAG